MTGPAAPRATPRAAPHIRVRGVGKSYGGVSVLRGIDLDIAPGEVHALVGENGAGKSTLLKVLGGAVRADAGEVSFDGVVTTMTSPRDAIAQGVSLITQEGALVPAMTVLDNVVLGRWRARAGWVARRADRAAFDELLARTGFDLDATARVKDLSTGAQQQVEVLRALARGARVIAFDEPTAVLTEHEKAGLLQLMRDLAAGGTTVLLVSHFLEEVLAVADRLTVLRDGDLVHSGDAAEQTPASLVRHMVGRQVDVLYPAPPPVPDGAPVLLEAVGLSRTTGARPVHDVDLRVRAGEVLGVAGLVGSGRSELLHLLFGSDTATSGTVSVDGTVITRPSPRAAMAAGVALVPESRKEQGLVLVRSIAENTALASLAARARAGFVRRRPERSAVERVSRSTDVRAADPTAAVGALSGGNQQKVLFAKWLLREPRVLLVDEPTRGVDVAAKTQLHHLVVDLARQGRAVVVVSSEVEEVLALSHRVLVLRHGRVVGEFGRDAPREAVVALAFGDDEPTDQSTDQPADPSAERTSA
ncbi:sugar ABC transporter ATP-binding protein [Quadrisphaera oryzae]|uniref:sugar ABC transporter ATP-binding protein n=1 Tax=Quadrisphaera TaxID=317661 RepID=UPI001644A991|nr:sugar ABC transporter ATP-binding protein [Quadrisphaera sp. RL12-1S]